MKSIKYYVLKQTDSNYDNEITIGIYFTMKQVDSKLAEIYNKDFKYGLYLMQDGKVLESMGMEIV